MKFEDLKKVNDELKTVDIGRKPYIQVNDRVQGFRKLYEYGGIETELITYIPDDYCVFKATAYTLLPKDDGSVERFILATGYAQETVEKNRNINRTSMLENCETSAVGRALGFLGIGSVDSIASADEVNKAQNKAKELDEVIGEELARELAEALMKAGQSPDAVVRYNKVDHLWNLTYEQYNNVKRKYLKK